MQKSKLFQILKNLDNKELKQLTHFVASPLFNSDSRCSQLLALLLPYLKTSKPIDLDKKILFQQLFPHKKYGPSLAVLMSALLRLVEDFLAFKELKEQPYERERLVLQSFIKRGIPERVIDSNFQKIGLLYKNRKRKEVDERLGFLNVQKNYFQYVKNTKAIQVGDLASTLLHDLNEVHTLLQLQFYLDGINLRNVQVFEFDEAELKKVLAQVKKKYPARKHPQVYVLYKAINMLLTESEEAYFRELSIFLEQNYPLIAKEYLIDIYALMSNYCIRRVQEGKISFLQELFEIYKKMVSRKALYRGKYLPIGRFRNIISLGCQLQELEWTERFLRQNIPHISIKHQASIQEFSLATIFFYKGDFKNTIHHLNEMATNPADSYYEINRRFLLLKSYYELGESNALRSNALAFKVFVRTTKKISAINKKGYYNFTNLLLRIYKVKNKDSKMATLQTIKIRIGQYEHLSDKKWLLEKISDLE